MTWPLAAGPIDKHRRTSDHGHQAEQGPPRSSPGASQSKVVPA